MKEWLLDGSLWTHFASGKERTHFYIEILSLLELDLSLFSHFARTLPLCILAAAFKLCENWTSLFAVLTIVHKVGQKSWCQKNYTNNKVSLCEKKG